MSVEVGAPRGSSVGFEDVPVPVLLMVEHRVRGSPYNGYPAPIPVPVRILLVITISPD